MSRELIRLAAVTELPVRPSGVRRLQREHQAALDELRDQVATERAAAVQWRDVARNREARLQDAWQDNRQLAGELASTRVKLQQALGELEILRLCLDTVAMLLGGRRGD